jgi:Tho complex subunit 7
MRGGNEASRRVREGKAENWYEIYPCLCLCRWMKYIWDSNPANDRHVLKGQIEQLKTSLEDAQLLRRRKIEYDQVAEKINVFPTREELQQWALQFYRLSSGA